jgi:hypothetical protein
MFLYLILIAWFSTHRVFLYNKTCPVRQLTVAAQSGSTAILCGLLGAGADVESTGEVRRYVHTFWTILFFFAVSARVLVRVFVLSWYCVI